MKLSDIEEQWAVDCRIDSQDLVNEGIRSPLLHAKYHKILNYEKIVLIQMERDLKRLRLQFQNHAAVPDRRGMETGFLSTVGPTHRIIKTDIPKFEAGDEVLTKHEADRDLQTSKVKYLESILWQIAQRKDHIANANKTKAFESGI